MVVFKSQLPHLSIPETGIYDYLFTARPLPNKPALIDGFTGETLSYPELKQRIDRLAGGLAQYGIKPYDVIGVFSPNHLEYAVAVFAGHKLGAAVTTANPTYTVDELRFQLSDAKPRVLFTQLELLETAKEAAKGTPVEKIFVFGNVGVEGVRTLRDLERNGVVPPAVQIKDPKTRTAFLCYSSGTTGRPKGVETTHFNVVANVLQTGAIETVTPDDVWLLVLPLYHCYGLIVSLCYGIYAQSTIVLQPKFDLEHLLRIIQTYKVTHAHLVPPIIIGLAKHPIVDKYNVSSIQTIFSGAAPLGKEIQAETAARLKCIVKQGYGMTELSPLSHASLADPKKLVPGSVGLLVSNMEAKLVNPETGKELGYNEEGELWLRGPNVMKGYLNRPDATAETIDKDGFLHTGDIAYVNKEGYYFITDRLKELIKVKGLQVAPAELEAVLLTHPAVADAAVIGIPEERAGEVPKAFVVLKPGQKQSNETAENIIAFMETKLAPHKKLRGGVQFMDVIPKAASGKILRRVLRDLEKQQKQKPASKL